MKRGNGSGVISTIVLLTIIDIFYKYGMWEKLDFPSELLFPYFYIDAVVLLITVMLYRFRSNVYFKNGELEEEN